MKLCCNNYIDLLSFLSANKLVENANITDCIEQKLQLYMTCNRLLMLYYVDLIYNLHVKQNDVILFLRKCLKNGVSDILMSEWYF